MNFDIPVSEPSYKTIVHNAADKIFRQRAYYLKLAGRWREQARIEVDATRSAYLMGKIEVLEHCTRDLEFILGRLLKQLPPSEADNIKLYAARTIEDRFPHRSKDVLSPVTNQP